MKLFKKAVSLAAVLALAIVALPFNASAAADVVDFENGKFDGFSNHTKEDGSPDGDQSKLSVIDYNGSKVLFVETTGEEMPKIKIDVVKIVGSDNIDKIRAIEMDIALENPSGDVVGWNGGAIGSNQGEDLGWYQGQDWFLEEYDGSVSEFKTIKSSFSDAKGFVNGTEGMYLFMNWGEKTNYIYIDNVRFIDADGNNVALASGEAPKAETTDTDAPKTETPKTETPKTGENNTVIYIAIAGLAIVAGGLIVNKKRNEINA